MDMIDYRCPRCGMDAIAHYYGPCDTCREELRTIMRNDAPRTDPQRVSPEYEPKINVTPNAVALRDD